LLAVAAQAFIVIQIGLFSAGRVGEAFREATERLAGIALLGLGGVVLIERLS
jgi:putative Mn2+ efflux pump MntP